MMKGCSCILVLLALCSLHLHNSNGDIVSTTSHGMPLPQAKHADMGTKKTKTFNSAMDDDSQNDHDSGGLAPHARKTRASFCPVCGKIGSEHDDWNNEYTPNGNGHRPIIRPVVIPPPHDNTWPPISVVHPQPDPISFVTCTKCGTVFEPTKWTSVYPTFNPKVPTLPPYTHPQPPTLPPCPFCDVNRRHSTSTNKPILWNPPVTSPDPKPHPVYLPHTCNNCRYPVG